MKKLLKIVPWLILAVFITEIVVVMMPKKDGGFHVREFGRLPVLLGGRIQPMDSVARNSLLQIRSTGDVPLEEVPSWKFWKHGKKLKASEWLLEVLMKPELADTRPIFLIHHPELLGELKLADKGVEKSGLRYYTFDEIRSVAHEIGQQGQKAGDAKAEERTPFQRQAFKLANAVMLYHRLKNSLQPEGVHDFAGELASFKAALKPGIAAAMASQEGKDYDKAALDRLIEPMGRFDMISRTALPLIVPPLSSEESRDHWINAGVSLMESARRGEIHPAMDYFATMATAFHDGQPAAFNQAVAGYREWLSQQFQPELKKGRWEFYFNDTKSFLHAMIIYLTAFVLAVGGLLTLSLAPGFSEMLRRSSFYLVILAGVVHTFGLIFRMILEGRPPVTNLYSSAIFIGWGAMVMGLILERVFRVGLGNAVASIAGFITLIIAHNLALGGDTMEMLQAVLDTNFWLATHVTVVTLGYASTFVAGLLALAYIVLGLVTPVLSMNAGRATISKVLAKMVYAIVCFASLFSFVGTILGGIWADQSWGRFWGWDPKENGALIIVLWNAVILHARWSGWIRERGLMTMAVFGNIVTSFSWFGVNMLGIGLHAYGFMDGAFKWLYGFIATQLLFIVIGCLPLSLWRSFRGAAPTSDPRPPAASA